MTNQAPACMRIGAGICTARYGHHVSLLDEQQRKGGTARFTRSTVRGKIANFGAVDSPFFWENVQ